MHVTSNGGISLPRPSIAGLTVAKHSRRHFVGFLINNEGAGPGAGSFEPLANATEARLRPARKINPGIAFRMED